tara:strand:- start:375 stop:866 length:492 start_codon:yes stop_codon:yes gene_type:complete
MNTEVEISTNVDVEFDDSVVWDAIEDSVNDAAREAVDNGAWDAVCGDVETMIDDMISNNGTDMGNVDEHLQSLLVQLASRTRAGDTLCGLGTSARDAIVAVVRKANETGGLAFTEEHVNQVRVDQDLDVQHRIATLERQVKTLLRSLADIGERAASVIPDSVV